MYKIWFEREAPPKFAHLYQDIAASLGPASLTPDEPFADLPQAHAIVASILRYTGEVMDIAPNLLIISRTGIGYDKVDVPAATQRGIAVCNAPEGPTISTAEHAITLMLGVAKKVKWAEYELRHSGKRDFFKDHFGVELYRKTLALVGLGRIGTHVARITQAMGMTVLAYDPYVSPAYAAESGITLVPSLPDLLGAGDVVSLHVPLTDATHHMMNAVTFAQMKWGAIFINTARGGLVDEDALLNALDSQQLFGAGLDVMDPFPPAPDHPLLKRDDVIITPHIASATYDGKDRIYGTALSQVAQLLGGERPAHLVNPEVWPRVVQRWEQQRQVV